MENQAPLQPKKEFPKETNLALFEPKNFPELKNDLMIRAAKKEKTERVPIWIMRQAGRYLPEFRALRVDTDFFQVCRTPELACELTLQPIRRYPLDSAIIFSDILVILQAMGLEVQMKPGKGPVLPNPIKEPADLSKLVMEPNVNTELGYVFKAITLTRHKLEGKVPLIGFSGAPWTLFAYAIEGEGSKTWSKAKKWLYEYPKESHLFIKNMTLVIIEYLKGQIKAGAQLVQVFDSWAGELAPEIFDEFCLPYLSLIASELKKEYPEIPLIGFAKGANSSLKKMAETKYDVLGLDWTMDAEEARKLVGDRVALQGNMDPAVLYASKEVIEKTVQTMLKKFGGQGHIANLGHGLHPDHDPTHVGYFIDAVQKFSQH